MTKNDLEIMNKKNNEWIENYNKKQSEHEENVRLFFEKLENHLAEKYYKPSDNLSDSQNEILKWSSLFGALKGLLEANCYQNKELFRLLQAEPEYLNLYQPSL